MIAVLGSGKQQISRLFVVIHFYDLCEFTCRNCLFITSTNFLFKCYSIDKPMWSVFSGFKVFFGFGFLLMHSKFLNFPVLFLLFSFGGSLNFYYELLL